MKCIKKENRKQATKTKDGNKAKSLSTVLKKNKTYRGLNWFMATLGKAKTC